MIAFHWSSTHVSLSLRSISHLQTDRASRQGILSSRLFDIVLGTDSCGYVLLVDNYGETSFTFVLIAIAVPLVLQFDENESMYYCAPGIHTIINAWCLARFCDAFDVMYPADVFTVYFLLRQCMFIKLKGDYSGLPVLSVNLYRVSICRLVAPTAFFIHDVVLRYLSNVLTLALFWEESVTDM